MKKNEHPVCELEEKCIKIIHILSVTPKSTNMFDAQVFFFSPCVLLVLAKQWERKKPRLIRRKAAAFLSTVAPKRNLWIEENEDEESRLVEHDCFNDIFGPTAAGTFLAFLLLCGKLWLLLQQKSSEMHCVTIKSPTKRENLYIFFHLWRFSHFVCIEKAVVTSHQTPIKG